jgi:hypothetical protein
VTCFKSYISDVAFPGQPIWKIDSNRFVEIYNRCNAQATETEIVETSVSFAVRLQLLEFRSSKEGQFESAPEMLEFKTSNYNEI